jgi:hypothetical protein
VANCGSFYTFFSRSGKNRLIISDSRLCALCHFAGNIICLKGGPRFRFYMTFDGNKTCNCKFCYAKSISLHHDCIIFSGTGQHTKIEANGVFLELSTVTDI